MVGVSLNPATPLSAIEEVLGLVDLVLVMTVHPGFGGQPFRPEMMEKVRRARELIGGDGAVWLQVDGGVSASTIEQAAEAGADCFVAGSAVYSAQDPGAAVAALRNTAAAHQARTG